MVASHHSFSANGQEVARDLAPFISGLHAPRPDGHKVITGRLCQAKLTLPRLQPGQRGDWELRGYPRPAFSPPRSPGPPQSAGRKVFPDRFLVSSWDLPRDLLSSLGISRAQNFHELNNNWVEVKGEQAGGDPVGRGTWET